MQADRAQVCALPPQTRVLTCSTLELGEDGLGLAVPLPTLLQGKMVHVSNQRPTASLIPLPGTPAQPEEDEVHQASSGQGSWGRVTSAISGVDSALLT